MVDDAPVRDTQRGKYTVRTLRTIVDGADGCSHHWVRERNVSDSTPPQTDRICEWCGRLERVEIYAPPPTYEEVNAEYNEAYLEMEEDGDL